MEDEVGEIIVTGDRPPAVDPHPGLAGGPAWFGGGGGGGGDDFYFYPPLPIGGGEGFDAPQPDDEPAPEPPPEEAEGPEIVVRPSEGQEGFADDNDPFNDGVAPTLGTVLSWLSGLQSQGFIGQIDIIELNEDQTSYVLSTTDSLTGDVTYFYSDGASNYGVYNVEPPALLGPDPVLSMLDTGASSDVFFV